VGLSRSRIRTAARRAEEEGMLLRCSVCSEKIVVDPTLLFSYVVTAWTGDEVSSEADRTPHKVKDHPCGPENLIIVESGHSLLDAALPSPPTDGTEEPA
jgi:hypothetical protein